MAITWNVMSQRGDGNYLECNVTEGDGNYLECNVTEGGWQLLGM